MSLASTYNKLPVSIKKRIVNWYRFLPSSKKTVIKEIDGITYELDLSRLVHAQLYHYGVWEPDTTKIINKYVKSGMNVFDIGASSGVHTLRLADLVQWQKGKVFAFEPSDWMYEKLLRNLELNRHLHNIIVAEKIALSDKTEKGEFESTEHGKLGRPIDEPMINVSFMKLDDYVKKQEIKHVDFIKIDTDGYEVKIFKGGEKTLTEYKPVMSVEFRPSLCVDLLELLSSLDYNFYRQDTEKQLSKNEVVDMINKEVINVLCR